MNTKKKSVFLVGYITNAENCLEKVGSVKLAASSEEWDEVVAAHKKAMQFKEEGRHAEWEEWTNLPGIKGRSGAVRKLMEKHFKERFVMVDQVPSGSRWPNRNLDTWKATTQHLKEQFMHVERSDGQAF